MLLRPAWTLLLLVAGGAAACSAVLGIGDLPIQSPDAAVGPDGSCPDASCVGADAGDARVDSSEGSSPESSQDASDAAEAGPTCAAIDDAGFHDMASPGCWSTFDTTTVNPGAAGFIGVAFDGRYLYLAPNYNGRSDGIVARYDTQGGFTSTTSWATFDITTVNAGANGFAGAVFDGRYVYFVPNISTTGAASIVARYDTTATFTSASSWSMFDTATVNPNAVAFEGGVFDGRYLYLVPFGFGGVSSIVARYDTTAAPGFTSSSSWTTFDTTTVNPNTGGFIGGIFDGRFVYFVPYQSGSGLDGVVTRYDTTFGFSNASSWSTVDVANLSPMARGFWGGAFDGRYVYLVPADNGISPDGFVARYDTTQSFTVGSFATFDTSSVSANAVSFGGSVYDGRFVYLLPDLAPGGETHGHVTRYDTNASFTLAASWSVFDTTTIRPNARGYISGAFDGRYVYLIPYVPSGIVARFDARSPAAPLPSFYKGSFF